MKKVYLLLAATLSMFMIHAQSLTLVYEGETMEENELEVLLNPEREMDIQFVGILNNLDKPITFRIEKDTSEVSEGNYVVMCAAGSCLPREAMATDNITLEGEELYLGFDLEYTYTNLNQSVATFKFIEDGTNETLATLKVTYKSTSSVSNLQNEKQIVLSAVAQPNPATTFTTFNYSVPANYKSAQLVVRNSLGSVIKNSAIKVGTNGKVTMNTSDLANGVYFYSIVADNATLITKKLVVKH